uniref:Uncharacterized protein n=1 Tax=Cucumis melo TaxID=3656 RepID=A0A9I9DFK8_CUCME
MSSLGASYAKIHLLQKQQKEKLERMEPDRFSRGETATATGSSSGGSNLLARKNKVHPGNIAPTTAVDSYKNRT